MWKRAAVVALLFGIALAVRHGLETLTFIGFSQAIELPAESARKVQSALIDAQIELLNLLCEPTGSGQIPLVAIFTNKGQGLAFLHERIGGGTETYLSRAEQIKQRFETTLRESLGWWGFRKYKQSGVDIFKVHSGNLNRRNHRSEARSF